MMDIEKLGYSCETKHNSYQTFPLLKGIQLYISYLKLTKNRVRTDPQKKKIP